MEPYQMNQPQRYGNPYAPLDETRPQPLDQTAPAVIQIPEELSQKPSQLDSTLNSTQQIRASSPKPYYRIQPKPKQSYWLKQSIHANQLYLKTAISLKQIDAIHQVETKLLFPNNDFHSQEHMNMAVKALDMIFGKCKEQQYNPNVIKIIELLYKKYIIEPVRQQEQDTQPDFYDTNIIYGERYYSFDDGTLKEEEKAKNEATTSKVNPYARSYPETYGNCMDSESTAPEYHQNISAMYINGIRKEKLPQTHFQNRPPHNLTDKKPPISRSDSLLPFDIQIPIHTSRKQFNPGYNILQGPDDQKNQRFQEERTIAKTFVKTGYGLQIVREHIKDIDGGAYNRAITTIIRESYKKIEDFLLKQCQAKIQSLTSSEFSLVKTPLVHCRNTLNDNDRSTFFKYIAITYKFGRMKEHELPTVDETMRLHEAILKGMIQRREAKTGNPKAIREKDMYSHRDKDMYYR